MRPGRLEVVVAFPFLPLPFVPVSDLTTSSQYDGLKMKQLSIYLRLLRCARRFCIRRRSIASGSVRSPALGVVDDLTIVEEGFHL